MHRHRSLSGTGHPLNNEIYPGRLPDNGILLLLDGSNDLAQNRLFVSGQILGQQFIIGHHIRIKEVLQPVIFNLIGPLPF